MFPLLNFAMMGLTNPMQLAGQMAAAGIGPEMMAPQFGLGELAQPTAMPMPEAAGQMAATAPPVGQPMNAPDNAVTQLATTDPDIYKRFMGTVQQHFSNPNALAAIAATGQRESGYSPTNAYGVWDDVGKPAGGIMSWRAERLDALRQGRQMADMTPELQAEYFVNEAQKMGFADALEQAKSPTEAMQIMNQNWAFKGFDKPDHPETMARFEAANQFAENFGGMGGGAGNVGSSIDFARAAGDTERTPAISPGGETTGFLTSAAEPPGGGLNAVGSSAGQTMQAGNPQQQPPPSLGSKLAQIGKGMGDQKAYNPPAKPQTPSHAPQVGGAFQPDLQQIMALLQGAPGGPVAPSLAAMINPKVG